MEPWDLEIKEISAPFPRQATGSVYDWSFRFRAEWNRWWFGIDATIEGKRFLREGLYPAADV
jgi:hypothetical protein